VVLGLLCRRAVSSLGGVVHGSAGPLLSFVAIIAVGGSGAGGSSSPLVGRGDGPLVGGGGGGPSLPFVSPPHHGVLSSAVFVVFCQVCVVSSLGTWFWG